MATRKKVVKKGDVAPKTAASDPKQGTGSAVDIRYSCIKMVMDTHVPMLMSNPFPMAERIRVYIEQGKTPPDFGN